MEQHLGELLEPWASSTVAYDGVGAFWMPFFVFFGWMVAMTVTTFQAISRHQRELETEAHSVLA